MQRYFLQLSYNGKKYNGWQVQENAPHTVQQVLQETLGKMLPEKQAFITGCGRTDRGVHAEDFYAHLDTARADLHADPNDFLFKVNKALPNDIGIKKILPVKEKASSRYDATSRIYEYRIIREKDPFLYDYTWHIFGALDFELMQKACEIILATRNFGSFAKSNDQNHDNFCIIKECRLFIREDGVWIFRIEANRFVRNMVRALVGTLINIGKGRTTIEELHAIIDARKRESAGMSAPAQGLFLVKVNYPDSIFLRG
jgi:tRNA pseudouridine38-40 synthase